MLRRFACGALLAASLGSAHAETIDVRDHGQIDLAPFACQDVMHSRYVRRVCYDAAKSYMLVNVEGAYYQYCEVGQGTVDGLLGARSADRYFDRNVIGHRRHRAARFGCRDQEPSGMQALAPATPNPPASSLPGTPPVSVKAWGYGAETCAVWSKDHHSRDAEDVSAEDSWLNGFITAFEAYGHGSQSVQTLETMTDWIDSHCKANPNDTLSVAAQAFTRTIAQRP